MTKMSEANKRFVKELLKDFDSSNAVFPTFLSVSVQIKNKLDSEDFGLDMLVPLINLEPVLAARLLGIANSAYYGGHSVKDVKSAVLRLGSSVVRAVSFATAVQQLAQSDSLRCVKKEADALLHHSLSVASWAYALAAQTGGRVVQEEALFVALVQDIGRLYVLVKATQAGLCEDRKVLVELVQTWHLFSASAVLDALGVDVCCPQEIGAYAGDLPPMTMRDTIACAHLLSDQAAPFSTMDAVVRNFLIDNMKERLADSWSTVVARAEETRRRALEILSV